ncbi:hypothetical protein [Demequina soli]|uniref:hypothetical protein n=1 Tax=Demequina soli TaxID=1638987 RepID=UPI000783E373|nr:hypothetical protein [Demequina soli]
MEHFANATAPTTEVVDGIAWRRTSAYTEAKVAVESAWVPVYLIRVDENVGAAVTCWDHQFDVIIDNLTKLQIEKVLRRLQPTWFACADNATKERYGDGALLELLDPDTLNRKWMIGVMFSHESTDPQAAAKAMAKVTEISLAVFAESSNKASAMDYARAATGGFFAGAARGMTYAERIMQAAKWIPS